MARSPGRQFRDSGIFLREWPETAAEFIDIVDRAVSVFDLNDETLTLLGAAGARVSKAGCRSRQERARVRTLAGSPRETQLCSRSSRVARCWQRRHARSMEDVARCAWLLIEHGVTDMNWFTAQFAVADCISGIKVVIALGMDAHA